MTETFAFTVVGCFPQEWHNDGEVFRLESTYVEHVMATDVRDAVKEAIAKSEDREESVVIAVFNGHWIDWLGQEK